MADGRLLPCTSFLCEQKGPSSVEFNSGLLLPLPLKAHVPAVVPFAELSPALSPPRDVAGSTVNKSPTPDPLGLNWARSNSKERWRGALSKKQLYPTVVFGAGWSVLSPRWLFARRASRQLDREGHGIRACKFWMAFHRFMFFLGGTIMIQVSVRPFLGQARLLFPSRIGSVIARGLLRRSCSVDGTIDPRWREAPCSCSASSLTSFRLRLASEKGHSLGGVRHVRDQGYRPS